MKNEFLSFINKLMEANPELTESLMTENIKRYLETFSEAEEVKPEVTENGLMILQYMQTDSDRMFKAKDIAEGLCVSSRSVSGSIRKLITDGFVEKIGQNPSIYLLTEKGKNYIVNKGENE